jgi:hypothetical protein
MRLHKHLAALAFGAALALPAAAQANEIGRNRTFGLGVVAGYPGFGISANVFFNEHLSLQIDPQLYVYNDYTWLGGRVDLLFYPGQPLVRSSSFDLKWYIGPGLGFAFGLDSNLGAVFVPEVPIGIGFQFSRVPIDLMIEAVPQFWIYAYDRGSAAGFNIYVSGALHARYYF